MLVLYGACMTIDDEDALIVAFETLIKLSWNALIIATNDEVDEIERIVCLNENRIDNHDNMYSK